MFHLLLQFLFYFSFYLEFLKLQYLYSILLIPIQSDFNPSLSTGSRRFGICALWEINGFSYTILHTHTHRLLWYSQHRMEEAPPGLRSALKSHCVKKEILKNLSVHKSFVAIFFPFFFFICLNTFESVALFFPKKNVSWSVCFLTLACDVLGANVTWN